MLTQMYKEKKYRRWTGSDDLVSFEVIEKQTDLFILAEKNLRNKVRAAILTYRGYIENYIKKDRRFFYSLEPIKVDRSVPEIIKRMADASKKAGVGPMASVAGAIAEFVGRDLSSLSGEIIIENGGDIFLRSSKIRTLGIFAGDDSPFTGKLNLEVPVSKKGLGICTSSGTVSHSLSFGKADAVIIMSEDTILADAVATAAGNIVKEPRDIEKAIKFARAIHGVKGVLILAEDKIGSWGDVKLV